MANKDVMANRIIDLIVALKHKCSIREEDIQQEFSLSQAEYHGVVVMESGEKITCSEFSERLGLSPSRGSRIIGKMMEKGFINYDSIPGDRRAHSLSLTPKGKRVKIKVEQKKDECEKTIREHYSEQQAGELKTTLTGLLEAL
ncbi:MAG: winged helix-turn-helix transcriptional regulator [Chitinispirillaceae bacterium]|nr:winged helix-turn-helix transcriptional regulator [Chitinispirillaceae bacterium]